MVALTHNESQEAGHVEVALSRCYYDGRRDKSVAPLQQLNGFGLFLHTQLTHDFPGQ